MLPHPSTIVAVLSAATGDVKVIATSRGTCATVLDGAGDVAPSSGSISACAKAGAAGSASTSPVKTATAAAAAGTRAGARAGGVRFDTRHGGETGPHVLTTPSVLAVLATMPVPRFTAGWSRNVGRCGTWAGSRCDAE